MIQLNVLSIIVCSMTTSFAVLKVTGQIDWTWIQVFTPIWSVRLTGIILVIIGILLLVIGNLLIKIEERQND